MSTEKSYRTDLKGILRFLLDHTQSEDAKHESSFKEMDSEKKQFLESALNCMTTDVMKEESNSEVADKVAALNIVRESVDDIDFANSFVKAGGSVYLIHSLSHSDSEIKCLAAYVIAEMSQNNPFCQQYFVDAKTMPKLIKFLNEPQEIAKSGLHAISSLLQNFEPGQKEFLDANGIDMLLACLNTNNSRMTIRVCFLIAKLAEIGDLRDEFIEKMAIAQLVKCLPNNFAGYDNSLETTLYALSELSKSTKWNVDESEADKLKTLISSITGKSDIEKEHEEIYLYACTIRQRLP
ncbi:unnamed protein product [Ceratitis capitata]|uniref:(Mediterranean fruit fly) hypothetical protein n=1 Tax=Ceratitis capitata TaxID=7213 RepID=A0A811UH63_CERCA|nr:unnamed protein product [Ceratitis capitata]